MNPQIKKVTYYIENHLEEELEGQFLAKMAGYSHYHFCRIFKLNVGESVLAYTTRLRLQRASREVSLGHKSMIEIALDAGYKTPTGFLKAFKKQFGTTPTAYQNNVIGIWNRYKDVKMENIEIVERDEAYVVFTRELGEYDKSSEIAWRRLSDAMNGLGKRFQEKPPQIEMSLGMGNGEALGICHDDPQVTDEANIRYDAALAWGKAEIEELAKYDFETKRVAGGKYAKTHYQGDYAKAEEAWYGVYAWIEKNGYEFRDEPAFEKYLNAHEESDPNKIETEVYVPIQ
ncbi:MAG TPA: AraC family transcriptional regulator [Campylobacterales bacterium]|nr:AraC family transcriptional regulator [Campylobacterales bacterium]HHS92372.1 AraC family transcriptional regulator [Campylobacterales bacterium]